MAKKNSIHTLPKPKGNPLLPKVPLKVGDEEYTLAYDFNAIAKAEELTGLNLFTSFSFQQLSVTKFRAMLFASLLKYQPKITVEQVGSLITAQNLAEITIKMVEAWHASRPDVTDQGNAEAEEASAEGAESNEEQS